MFVKSIIPILFFILSSGVQPEFKLEKELDLKADFITSDQIGNLYLAKGSEMIKYDFEKNQKQSYSNVLTGNISSIDSSDPFRILVFYKDFNKLVFLDKNLTEILSPISLDDFGYYHVVATCQSINGGFWIFDQSLYQLVYFDKALNVVKKSTQLQEIIGQINEQSQVFMLEKNDYIYLGIKDEGILLFDHYGTYIKTFPVKIAGNFQVNNNIINYLTQGDMQFYNTNNYQEYKISLPLTNIKQALISNTKLFVNMGNKIVVYRMNNF